MMNLRRLQLLYDLSVCKTITRVAQLHGLTRPAVSRQLALLEQELQVSLFEREGRGVRLTPAGIYLVQQVAKIAVTLEKTEHHIRSGDLNLRQTLRIAAFGSAINALLPSLVHSFVGQGEVQMLEYESAEGLKAVANRQVDLAITLESHSAEQHALGLSVEVLCQDQFVAVLPVNHPKAKDKAVSLGDLSESTWAVNQASSQYFSVLLNHCRAYGFEPKIGASCRNMLATLNLVGQCAYVTVLPFFGLYQMPERHDIRVLKLCEPLSRHVYTVVRKGSIQHPPMQQLRDSLRQAAQALSTEVARL